MRLTFPAITPSLTTTYSYKRKFIRTRQREIEKRKRNARKWWKTFMLTTVILLYFKLMFLCCIVVFVMHSLLQYVLFCIFDFPVVVFIIIVVDVVVVLVVISPMGKNTTLREWNEKHKSETKFLIVKLMELDNENKWIQNFIL